MESGELNQQNRASTEVGQGTTKDNIARDEKDYRGLAKKLGELTWQSYAQTYLVRLLALIVKGLESILKKGLFLLLALSSS